MAKGLIEQESLTNIANAIRSKNGKTVKYTPAEMPEAIMDISGLDGFPIGGIAAYGGTAIPDGWLLCDGSTVSRELYSDLFKAVGTVFGEGDGSTTFALPNLSSKFIYGTSDTGTVGDTGGEETHTLTVNEMPSHDHIIHANIPNAGGNDTLILKNAAYWSSGVDMHTYATGGSQPHNNMPPYIKLYYIIKASQQTPIQAVVEDSLSSTSTTNALSANMGKVLKSSIDVLENKIVFLTTTVTANQNQNKQGFTYIKLPDGFTLDNTIIVGAMWCDNEMFMGAHLASDMVSNLAYGTDYFGCLYVNLGDIAYMVGEENYKKVIAVYYYPQMVSEKPETIYVRLALMKVDNFVEGEKITV